MNFTRRNFLQAASATGALVAATPYLSSLAQAQQSSDSPKNAEEALSVLKEGNRRFVSGNLRFPHTGKEWLKGLVKGQAPFATILGCADSRVPPELVFDQGFGDLFVVRVAGNVVDTDVEGSIEYSVDHCGTKLVVVMGHEGCGAVTAALKSKTDVAKEANEIQRLVQRIEVADPSARNGKSFDEALALSVESNVRASVKALSEIPDIAKAINRSGVMVIGGVYDIASGSVNFLE